MAGDSPVGPLWLARSARISSSAVAMSAATGPVRGDRASVAETRRRKSDATRQLSEDARDRRLISRATRLPGAGNLTPVTAERQFFEQIGGGFTWRHEARLHMTVRCD